MADIPKVVTAKVAARFVGLSESTLAKLRLNGNGPIYCKLGRRVVYRPADLEQWLQSRTTRDTSDADARFLKALTAAHPRRLSDCSEWGTTRCPISYRESITEQELWEDA